MASNEIPVQGSNQNIQSVTIDVMPTVTQPIKTLQPQIIVKPQETTELSSQLIYYMQGDEDVLQEELLNFFTQKSPKIVWETTWTVGITTYFLFIYR